MMAPLNTCTMTEQCGIVQFLWAKDMTARDIHKEMLPMCTEHCLSHQAVHNRVQKFSEGQISIEDIIRADRRVTIDTVPIATGCSHGQAYNTMDERLGFHKVCSCWVPCQLTPQHKSQRMGLSLQHLQHYQDKGDDMLSPIVTGDASWMHHY